LLIPAFFVLIDKISPIKKKEIEPASNPNESEHA